jgi:hypothetical protein
VGAGALAGSAKAEALGREARRRRLEKPRMDDKKWSR